jgi:hypothetical protein
MKWTVSNMSRRKFRRFYPNDLVKSPPAALRFILLHCDVAITTPHSSGLARLACGAFSEIVGKRKCYGTIYINRSLLYQGRLLRMAFFISGIFSLALSMPA